MRIEEGMTVWVALEGRWRRGVAVYRERTRVQIELSTGDLVWSGMQASKIRTSKPNVPAPPPIAAKQKAYYEARRDEIAAKQKAYREARRDEIAAKKRRKEWPLVIAGVGRARPVGKPYKHPARGIVVDVEIEGTLKRILAVPLQVKRKESAA